MDKLETDAKAILNKLGEFSSHLTGLTTDISEDEYFRLPLEIMREAMAFDVSVLYEIANVIDDLLIIEIKQVVDPEGYRPDLGIGRKLALSLDDPDPIFINEVKAFTSSSISCINVPNQGCDMVGFIYLPDDLGRGYLFGGDYCGHESDIKDYEASVCEIMCNLLSSKLIKAKLQRLATHDSLTGLRNSKSIKNEVARIFYRFDRRKRSVASIAMCDIDHFKNVNDTYGHIQGDAVLEEIGSILARSMRKHFDLAGRYGGEEFLLIFDETTAAEAEKIVERIRVKIAGHPFSKCDSSGYPLEDESLSITMSFGVAEKNGSGDISSEIEWINRADRALYQSKKDGRNRTTLWSSRLGGN